LRSVLGSGQFGMPCARMLRAKFSRPVMIRGSWAWAGWRSDAQAVWAVRKRESLTPTCCGVTLGTPPRLAGSGKSGTPCDRMQREKATAWEFAVRELTTAPADGGRPPQAADRTRTAAVMMAATAVAGTGFMPAVSRRTGDITATVDVVPMSCRLGVRRAGAAA